MSKKGLSMKNMLILIALIFASESFAVCSSSITRSNYSALQVLTASSLNTQLNTVYARANELPGDCITDETITSAKILNGTIVNADISTTAAIENRKLSPNYTVSASDAGSFSTASLTWVDVTNLTADITTYGKPVEIIFVNKSSVDSCFFGVGATAGEAKAAFAVLRNGVSVGTTQFGATSTGSSPSSATFPVGSFRYIDIPAAGSYTYKIQIQLIDGTGTSVTKCRLMVREL